MAVVVLLVLCVVPLLVAIAARMQTVVALTTVVGRRWIVDISINILWGYRINFIVPPYFFFIIIVFQELTSLGVERLEYSIVPVYRDLQITTISWIATAIVVSGVSACIQRHGGRYYAGAPRQQIWWLVNIFLHWGSVWNYILRWPI